MEQEIVRFVTLLVQHVTLPLIVCLVQLDIISLLETAVNLVNFNILSAKNVHQQFVLIVPLDIISILQMHALPVLKICMDV